MKRLTMVTMDWTNAFIPSCSRIAQEQLENCRLEMERTAQHGPAVRSLHRTLERLPTRAGVAATGVSNATISSTSTRVPMASYGPPANFRNPSRVFTSAVYKTLSVLPVSSASTTCRIVLSPGSTIVGSSEMSWKTLVTLAERSPDGCHDPTAVPAPVVTSR